MVIKVPSTLIPRKKDVLASICMCSYGHVLEFGLMFCFVSGWVGKVYE